MFNDIRDVLERRLMAPAVRRILEEEEAYGAYIANRFRYIFLVFILIGTVINLYTLTDSELFYYGVKIYGIGILIYFLLTLAHSIILAKNVNSLNIFFGYITIIFDYSVLTGMMFAWSQMQSPDNFNYFLKNPGFDYFFLLFILVLIQIRIRLVIFSIILFFTIHFASLGYGLYIGVKLSYDWIDYILGNGIFLSDILIGRPLVFFCIAISVAYSIYRTVYMVRRIAKIESEKVSLSRYFSPMIVEEITKDPDILHTGKRQEVTILFQDIRNFTKMSEKMDPVELVEFLNEFRARMTRVVFANSGTLDKYIGDAIMATFGTPVATPDDPLNAVKAGLQMLASLKEWNLIRKNHGKEEIQIGIGLHSGEVFTGSIGFEGRMEYTVIGDAVNTASRIESLCKKFQAEFLISEEVYLKVKEQIEVEKLPPVEVKGKEKPLQIYRVIV